jgi:hypothetical protein
MPHDIGLATRLRDMGLRVKEVDGWRTRGSSSFHPRGAVTHHTAGAALSPGRIAPSLEICTHGRSDLAGPLCNIYMDYEGTIYTVAAGRANRAGIPDGGSCRGMTGNSSAWGFEIEHQGRGVLEPERAEIAAAAQAACIKGTAEADMVVYHKEWAPSRKPDLATAPSPDEHRARVAHYLEQGHFTEGGGTVTGNPYENVPAWFWEWVHWYDTTRRTSPRPKAAPAQIPEWAWEMRKRFDRNERHRGMTDGEQEWIVWSLGGKDPALRPDVPETIPEFWWEDLSFVQEQRKL